MARTYQSSGGSKVVEAVTYTRQQAAHMLGVGLTTLHQATQSGEIPCIRIGRVLRYRPETLKVFLETREDRLNPKRKVKSKDSKGA